MNKCILAIMISTVVCVSSYASSDVEINVPVTHTTHPNNPYQKNEYRYLLRVFQLGGGEGDELLHKMKWQKSGSKANGGIYDKLFAMNEVIKTIEPLYEEFAQILAEYDKARELNGSAQDFIDFIKMGLESRNVRINPEEEGNPQTYLSYDEVENVFQFIYDTARLTYKKGIKQAVSD